MTEQHSEWKPGLPPGKYYEGMVDDYEVYFSIVGMKWHRRRQKPAAPGKKANPMTEQLSIECPNCAGEGMVKIPPSFDARLWTVADCPQCNGFGWIPTNVHGEKANPDD